MQGCRQLPAPMVLARPEEAARRLWGKGTQRTGQQHKDVHLREIGKLGRRGSPRANTWLRLPAACVKFHKCARPPGVGPHPGCRQQPHHTGISWPSSADRVCVLLDAQPGHLHPKS